MREEIVTADAGEALTEPPRGDREAGARPPILVVSGLPRSGTSLMLQMLQAGGVPVLTDGRRAADEDNPEGYFEWEPIQTMAGRPACLAAAAGQAVKVVSPLLRALPADGCYQVLFMLRPLTEVVRSQLRMRARLGKGAGDPRWLAEQLRQHLRDALAWLRTQPQVAVLPVSYGGLVGAAARWSARVVGFLGRERVPHPERMAAVVRPELYRQRARVPGDGVHARQRGGWFRQSQ